MIFLSATLAIAGVATQQISDLPTISDQTPDIPEKIFYYHYWKDGRRINPFHIPPTYVQHPDFEPNYVHGDSRTVGWSTYKFSKRVSPTQFTYAFIHVYHSVERTTTYHPPKPNDPVRYFSSHGPVGDGSHLCYSTPPNVEKPGISALAWVDGIKIELSTSGNGLDLIGYQVQNPEPAFGILRYTTAVLLGNTYQSPVTETQKVHGVSLPTYKLHTNGTIGYRLNSLLKPKDIPLSPNYNHGVLTWKIKNKTFKVPLASKSYWINETRYSTDTFSVIHDGSFYVSKDIIEQSINALGK